MIKIEIEELKKREIEILQKLHNWCQENDCQYFLSGGSLIGAVRHKGFIPWDDDIDVIMPRKDYMKLIDTYPDGKDNLKICSHYKDKNYCWTFAKLSDTKTVLHESTVHIKTPIGVNIDIFPLDYLFNTQEESEAYIRKQYFIHELAYLSILKKYKKTEGIFANIKKLGAYCIAKMLGTNFWLKRIEIRTKELENRKTRFVGCVIGGYREREVFPAEVFEGSILIDFENAKFAIPKGYECYLTKLFDDYMKLPPPEKRITHHNYTVYEIEDK